MHSTLTVGTITDSADFGIFTSNGTVSNSTATLSSPVTESISDMLVTTSDFSDREKGILITAMNNESLFVLVFIETQFALGVFLGYPCIDFANRLTYTYYAISVATHSTKSQILLVGSTDNTTITIIPTQDITLPHDAQNSSSPLVNVLAETSHTVTLHQLQTLLVFVNDLDLTGTKVVSDNPLTVISGHECALVPAPRGFCEQLAVEIPPTVTWGTEFLLAPFAERDTGQFYKAIAAENDTKIQYVCGKNKSQVSVIEIAGRGISFFTSSSSYCYLVSNKPVFMVQLATGGDLVNGGDGRGDPAMAIVSPLSGYISSTNFFSIIHDVTSNAVSVTVPSVYFQTEDIVLDGSPLNCTWNKILNIDNAVVGYGCNPSIGPGMHNISHVNGGLLSVMAYGFHSIKGYAYLTGSKQISLHLQQYTHCILISC